MKIIEQNIALGRTSPNDLPGHRQYHFLRGLPLGFDQLAFERPRVRRVKTATKRDFCARTPLIRSQEKTMARTWAGLAQIHFHQHRESDATVRLVLKGGGCENVGRNIPAKRRNKCQSRSDGCRKAILDAVLQAQGKGCGPGILGVCMAETGDGVRIFKTSTLARAG